MTPFMLNWLTRRAMSAPRGGGDGVELPTLFQRVEYLHSDGQGSYILLPHGNKATYGIKATFTSFSCGYFNGGYKGIGCNSDPRYPRLIGVVAAASRPDATLSIQRSSNQVPITLHSNYKNDGLAFVEGFEGDGIEIPANYLGDVAQSNGLGFTLFRCTYEYSGGGVASIYASSLYNFQLTDGSDVIMNLYPCYRKSDGKPGMFDLVTRQFFTNANATGNDFTVGPDIPSTSPYIVFVDPAVEGICVANWSSDGIGLTMQDAAAVTGAQLGTTFQNNTNIVSFDELQYFTSVTSLNRGAFQGCTSLKSITLPGGVTLNSNIFFSDAALNVISIVGNSPITKDGSNIFSGCSSLTRINANNVLQALSLTGSPYWNYDNSAFRTSQSGDIYTGNILATDIVIPSGTTSIEFYTFGFLANTRSVDLPASVTSIAEYAFWSCPNLTTIICRSVTPPSVSSQSFIMSLPNTLKIYVPYSADHSILSAYQSASGWSPMSSKLYELNLDGTIPTT